jgi:addiction module HigA family antidote
LGDWTEERVRGERVDPPVHPGEVLKQEWLEPLGMNPNQLAKALGVGRQNVYDVVGGKRAVSADVALRLTRWSGVRLAFWLGLQADYDLRLAEWESGEEITHEGTPLTGLR